MPSCSVLIKATDGPRMKKGYPSMVHDPPWAPGRKEGLPNWVRLDISDAPASQVDHWMSTWTMQYDVSVLGEDESRHVVLIAPALSKVSLTGRGEYMMPDMLLSSRWCEIRPWNGTVTETSPRSMTVELPKPVNLVDFKAGFQDLFYREVEPCQFYCPTSEVDAIIAEGGSRKVKLAEATALMREFLME